MHSTCGWSQLEIRKKGLDTLLSDEEKHFNQKLDALKMDLEAANDEHARLDLLLVNGVADREEKVASCPASQCTRAGLVGADASVRSLSMRLKPSAQSCRSWPTLRTRCEHRAAE